MLTAGRNGRSHSKGLDTVEAGTRIGSERRVHTVYSFTLHLCFVQPFCFINTNLKGRANLEIVTLNKVVLIKPVYKEPFVTPTVLTRQCTRTLRDIDIYIYILGL